MSTFKSRLSELIDVRNERNPLWIPARLRGLIRRVSGGDSWTAQMLRGLLWQYRWLVGLALGAIAPHEAKFFINPITLKGDTPCIRNS